METPNATNLEVDVEHLQFKIYPMLLLPLLENSYKHGIIAGETKIPIQIKIIQHKKKFRFTITNANINTTNSLDNKHSGLGLENLRNNLNLVYPKKHQFKVEETKEIFKVTLAITNES